jgi:hypothetical protein
VPPFAGLSRALAIVCTVKSPIDAAVRVGSHQVFVTDSPILVQETNNTVVWLRPHAVIAKVGTRPHSNVALALEHRVATALAEESAPTALVCSP